MSFQIPEILDRYLKNTKYRKPFENFVNNSTFYAQLNWHWITYMETVVRPCIAYSTGAVDGAYNSTLSTATGMAIVRGAARLLAGDKQFFLGNDESCAFLSDIWAPQTNFNKLLNRAMLFMLAGGTSVLKWNRDEYGRSFLSAYRIDRTMIATNENGDITNAVFFVGLLTNMKNETQTTYWLVEERKYVEGRAHIVYKVFMKNGIANSPTLPSPYQTGIKAENLPREVRRELERMNISRLNEEIPLPVYDGLGVWLLPRTATNSCVPDAPFGDPLLYGCLDLLWSIDVVFSGTIIDVLNGEGKILVPKNFLQDTLSRLQAQYPNTQFNVTTTELRGYHDDSFVYVMPSGVDKEKLAPTPVQFDIRADQYGKMLEMYERLATVRAGYSPTSIFPYLTPDNSVKTATEVTAEENLTRASIRDMHNIVLPILNRALREVLRQEGLSADVQLQLGDYIGNKMQYDENVRQNFAAGLVPKEIAVKMVNNLTDRETTEYMEKIQAEAREQAAFTEEQYAGYLNDHSESTAESPGDRLGRSGNEDKDNGER